MRPGPFGGLSLMVTIHPEPHLLFVCDDGEGGHYIRIQGKDGSVQVWDLSEDRALRLVEHIVKSLRERKQKRPA